MSTISEAYKAIENFFANLPLPLLVSIFTALAFVLFCSPEIASTLAIEKVREEYRGYLGFALIITAAAILGRLITFVGSFVREKMQTRKWQKSLEDLTPEEQGYLAVYILENKNTIKVGMDDGVMGGLVAKGITYHATNQGTLVSGFAFNLQPWARKHLQTHHELLNSATGRPLTPVEQLHHPF